MSKKAFGIDIGGSGIKGAPVDLSTGELAADRVRIPTPQPSTPEAVADTVAELIGSFDVGTDMPVGVTFPAVIQAGVAQTAANVDKSWIGTDVDALLTERTGHDVFVVNDADAAGIAEMKYGAGRGTSGVVQVITLGTGVGSATFVDGTLVPNTELGHLLLHGDSAERYMASSIKEEQDLDWETWAGRLQEYFSHLEFLFSPTRIIIGGGVSKKHKHFLPLLNLKTEIVPAKLRNEAGIVGAAVLAHREEKTLLKAEKKAEKSAEKKERAKREAAK
ncbi:polyphosphate glucokinase [Brachybacterium avium]|uniref:Polyphosphate glucokinase n=1 Tax=Brachybacterium avium TaxID=2017485 RepID=A0A220U9J3_9MICO|nr:ROK family protein [Brachybacterium avium]ASK64632.1 polyphosphate glucokinase [Brachybacterium avium]